MPTLFIGSSTKSLDIAYATQENLDDVATVVVWTQGIFELGKFTLEALLDTLDEAEFALFVFAADDITKIHGAEHQTTRDNVVFELGLFMGRLGRERCFVITPKGVPDLHLPTDLLGMTVASFQPPDSPKYLQAALGPACFKVRQAVKKLGPLRPVTSSLEMANPELVLASLLNEHEKNHVRNLKLGHTDGYKGGGTLRSELRHLRAMKLLETVGDKHIGDMQTGMVFNLAAYVKLTKLGKQLAEQIG